MGPQSRRILQIYWRQITMVARSGVYYGMAFQVTPGVVQGDLLYPTIFNVVVDAVVRNWVKVVIVGAEERGERGK